MVDAALIILAMLCAYPMLYRATRGPERSREHFATLRATFGPMLVGAWWLLRKAAQPAIDHGPAPWAYVEDEPAEPIVEQRDAASVRPSAPSALVELALLDIGDRRDRSAALTLLVALGWTTAEIRSVVKGENAAIGADVDAARRRLGVEAPQRFVTIQGGKGGRVAV